MGLSYVVLSEFTTNRTPLRGLMVYIYIVFCLDLTGFGNLSGLTDLVGLFNLISTIYPL